MTRFQNQPLDLFCVCQSRRSRCCLDLVWIYQFCFLLDTWGNTVSRIVGNDS